MDFSFTHEQDEAAGLAARILADRATNERMKAVEADGEPWHGLPYSTTLRVPPLGAVWFTHPGPELNE